MNPVLRKHLEDARKLHGVTFDVLTDWDALQDLATLADAVLQADARGDAAMLRPCVVIGGVTFYRMTIGAGEWTAHVAPWFEDQDRLAILSWAFALAHARDPSALWAASTDRSGLVDRLKVFSCRIGATPEELARGLREFVEEEFKKPMPGDADAGESSPAPSGYGGMVDLLLSEYGGTPAQWVWETPRATVLELLNKIGQRKRAEAGSLRADPNDPRVIAGHRLVVRLQALVESKRGAA